MVEVPFDLASEPGSKAAYWIVSFERSAAAAERDLAASAELAATRVARHRRRSSSVAGSVAHPALAGAEACALLGRSTSCRLLLGSFSDGAAALLQIIPSTDPTAAATAERSAALHCEALRHEGLALPVRRGATVADGHIVVALEAPAPVTTSLRAAVHDGVRGCSVGLLQFVHLL
jgi:hypothetical protein